MAVKKFCLFAFVIFALSSCKDPEMDALMTDYCSCLNDHKGDIEGRFECIELMETIQKKYKNQPRKLQQVLEKILEWTCFVQFSTKLTKDSHRKHKENLNSLTENNIV